MFEKWILGKLVHPDDQNQFKFSVPRMDQLQPIKMPQGSCFVSFSFMKLMYLVLGSVPETESFPGIDFILVQKAVNQLPEAIFYTDDIFRRLENFEQGYSLLENELLPRLSLA